MKTKFALLSVVSFLLISCGSTSETTSSNTDSQAEQSSAQAPADPANAGYYIDGIVYTLVNGELEQAIEDSTTVNKFKLLDFKAAGDINKDGTDDVAVVVTNDAGGSGTFYYLAIFTSGSSPVIENTSYLGDRIVVNDITFTNNQFQVKYLDRDSESDMASDPTIEITGIAEMDAENTGFIFSCTDTAGICL